MASGPDRAANAQLSRKQILHKFNRAWSCNEFQPAWLQIFDHIGHEENDGHSLITLQGAEHSSPHPTAHLTKADLLGGLKGLSPSLSHGVQSMLS